MKIITWSRLLASNNTQSQAEKDAKAKEEKEEKNQHSPVRRDLCVDSTQSLETAANQQKPKGNMLKDVVSKGNH